MKKLILLVAVLAGLIGVAMLMNDSSETRFKAATTRAKLIENLDVNAVKSLRIKEGDKTVTIALKGDIWAVPERSDYPASFEKIKRLLVDNLRELKAGKQSPLGKGAWGRIKLNAPGTGKAEETGLQVELLGEGDKALHTLILGDTQKSSVQGQEANPMMGGGGGRFARLTSDPENFVWTVDGDFYELATKPEDWIDKAFFNVTNLTKIEVSTDNPANNWTVSRKDPAGDFAFEGSKDGEAFDVSKAAVTSLFQNAAFTDVLPKDKATADFMKGATKVKLTTSDAWTYDVEVLKKGTGSDEKTYLTMKVAASIKKERTPEKDEKPEDKKSKDEAFAATVKTAEEKLATEKKFEGWVYEVGSYTVEAVLKKRAEVVKDKVIEAPKTGDAAAPAAGSATPPAKLPILPPSTPAVTPPTPAPAAPPAPPAPPATDKPSAEATPPAKTPITVTTPPISVPPAEAPKEGGEAPKK